MAVIKVENLKKSYGDLVAVKEISFTVEKGAMLGFLGATHEQTENNRTIRAFEP